MIGLSVKGADTVAARLRAARQGVLTAQEAGVRRATVLVERALKLELSHKAESDTFWGKKGAADDGLAVRTGRTRAGITGGGTSYRVGDRVVGAVGSRDRHLVDHETGATVRGTSPKGFARIPTAAAQTGAGVDRNAGRSIRDIPGAFLFRSHTGTLWAAVRTFGSGAKQIRGKDRRAAFLSAQAGHIGAYKGGLMLLYLLVKSVRLRARHIFARVRREQEPRATEAMRSEVVLVVQQANG